MKLLDTKMRKFLAVLLTVLGLSCLACGEKLKHKRQIYREQVLPALGGKIPEEAFRTDRLALNRLNKDGITVIDGVLLEARDHDKNPDVVRSKPEVIKVYVTQDPRYVPPEGRYHNEHPKSVDTTYVLRKPVGHHDGSEQQRLNGIGNAPIHHHHHHHQHQHQQQQQHRQQNNNNNIHAQHSGGYVKSAEVPPQGLSPPKAHGFANFHRFVPHTQSSYHHQSQQQQQQQQQQQHHYATVYKPIITPLVIPARGIYYRKPYQQNLQHHSFNRQPSWHLSHDWSSFYHPREPLYFEDNNDFLDTHQIITDYEGFLSSFHGRSYRHIGSQKEEGSREKLSKDRRVQPRPNTFSDQGRAANVSSDKSARANFSPAPRNVSQSYTNLTSIPNTGFSCDGRKGTYADVETKCQVFHECSGWSKTSSLCPAGTAYSLIKKRCEWWNTVTCDSQ